MLEDQFVVYALYYIKTKQMKKRKKIPADYKVKLPEGYYCKLHYGNYCVFDSVERNTLIWGTTRHYAVKHFLEYMKELTK